MSDSLRKPFSDRVEEKITPDSSKSTVDKAKENVTTAADRFAGEMQPDSSKSSTQEGFDKSRREKDTIVDKVKNAVGLGN
ncbi:putative chaperone/heat shock protein Hsp12 [Pyronema domesticum]|uniref:Similar to Heat shock protein hsp9 acc. no. P50519 n=1 Tax=Pyronema omphalodes (strain CBS 100304) TaxID=1076935 RepID=U4LM63_PYROM|nr:putative chaperone/heat shock protein Hsp12 [Pyronema domesticum]CCX30425.1 Similar to Heat shock protein hsp9; acc. no. P50519 [Pyronema omphalodes CBS 100304]